MSKIKNMPARLDLHDVEQIEALTSPVANEIMDVLVLLREATVAELADELDRPAPTLYPHLERLADVGIIVPGEVRATGRRPAATWRPAARSIYLRFDPESAARRAALRRAVAARVRETMRELDAAFDDPETISSGPRRTAALFRTVGWLDATTLREINAMINELASLHENQPRRPRSRRTALTIALTPVRRGLR